MMKLWKLTNFDSLSYLNFWNIVFKLSSCSVFLSKLILTPSNSLVSLVISSTWEFSCSCITFSSISLFSTLLTSSLLSAFSSSISSLEGRSSTAIISEAKEGKASKLQSAALFPRGNKLFLLSCFIPWSHTFGR